MNRITLSDKPVKMIMENDIASDIVYADKQIKDQFDKIANKLMSVNDPRDFFFVVLDKKETVMGMITFDEIKNVLNKKQYTKKFGDLKIKPNILLYTDSIKDAMNKLRDEPYDIILIVDKNCKYFGKVKATTIQKRLNELFDTLSS